MTGAAVAAAVATAVVLIPGGDDAADPQPAPTELLSSHPLSRSEAERRLEARFTSESDDDTAAASCSALEPRPAHAIRRCRIRYPNGTSHSVVVMLDARGRELLSEH